MALPVPNLDDRRFQDLVDDAKRLIQQRCPEWTDHNVHDPGVTLVELFAFMTDQILYRLNRVPDRNYIKFLELIGVQLYPPTTARAPVTFWLAAPQPGIVNIPTGTEVATVRTETEDAIVFSTMHELPIVACELATVATDHGKEGFTDHTADLKKDDGFLCFSNEPKPGDVLLIGLSEAVPSNALTLRFECQIEGVGVDPDNPPLAWEASDGRGWLPCEVDHDETGGLNADGDLVLHVPAGHQASVISGQRAGWLRARVTDVVEGQGPYSRSPLIKKLSAFTIGGTVAAVNAEEIREEQIGVSEGMPGRIFKLQHFPVVPSEEAIVLEVTDGEGWQEWKPVHDFSQSGPDDTVFVLDSVSGEVRLAPGVRQPDGTLRLYGAVPHKDAVLRIRSYLTGGGRQGNVVRGAISVLKSSIPYIAGVINRRPAEGGVDGEDIENAKLRGPIQLRSIGRAVTTEDYEQLAIEAAPEVARVRAAGAGDGADAGGVRVLIVPAAESEAGRLRFEQLVPAEPTLQAIVQRLDQARVIGARVSVEPPVYRGVTVVARIRARPEADPNRLQEQALEALYTYFHPIIGGPDGRGWPFGRAVQLGEVYLVLQGLRGTAVVEDARLFGADPITGQRGQATPRLELEPDALIFSYEHQVLVEGA
jgi:predicted phage baseplate assembly protein